jgi:hypothetical protein
MKNMKKKEKTRSRAEKLSTAGFESEEIEEALSLYDALADEAFDAVVAMHEKQLAKVKKGSDKPAKKFQENITKDEPMEEDNPKASVAEEVQEELFEEVKTTEATLVAASDEGEEIESTRASVAEWLTNNVLRNK